MEVLYMLLAFVLGYIAGHKRGAIHRAKQIFKALGVPPGYQIDAVSFRKIGDRS
jgi:hypothetical protein